MSSLVNFSVLKKHGGALTKRISLGPEGRLISNGTACLMSRGLARRERADLPAFARLIAALEPCEAIALGSLRPDLPEHVEIATKACLDKLNGVAPAGTVARTGDSFQYATGEPAFALLDVDTKGIPPAVRSRVNALGGYWPAIVATLPELETAGHVIRRSTSTAISRTDTGEKLTGSDGLHGFVLVADGSDVDRFLRCLHDRCWLAGLGWMMVGAGGQLLRRCLVDRMVGAPERLVFEGPPLVDPPLTQDQAARRPIVFEGPPLDTIAACPDLTEVERAKLRELETAERRRLNKPAEAARVKFIDGQAARIVDRTGCSADAARQTVERQCAGILLPAVVLPFDDDELAGKTVADVLADPGRFEGATLADPLEGVEYGPCKARVMRGSDGVPWVHSFAHGRTVYELKYDAPAIEAAVSEADAKDAPT